MRKHFILFILACLSCVSGFAQINISIADISKFHLIDAGAYINGGYRNDYDLLLENGQWKAYQTHEWYQRMNPRARDLKALWIKKDTAEHNFIKTVSNDTVTLFLNTIGRIKNKFIPAELNLSISQLTHQIDTGFLKHSSAKQVEIFNSFFDTPAKLYHLLDTLQHDNWTDDYPTAAIEIIKKTGDTIKVYTNRQIDYMLPWQINGRPSYDLNINKFFLTVTNLKKHRLSGSYLFSQIYSWVNFLYADDAFERLRWEETAPENTRYIKQHFDIIKLRSSNDISTCTLHPKHLNIHVQVGGWINIRNNKELKALVNFAEDTLPRFLKAGGFMMDSCKAKKGCIISFTNSNGSYYHGYFSLNQKGLDTYLNKYKTYDIWPFTIKAGERTEDEWIKLPNGEFILTRYIDDHAIGVKPIYIKTKDSHSASFVFMIFSKDGKLLSENN